MFDQPEFDYVPQFNFNYLNTQSTGRIGFKWFQNGLMTKRHQNGHLKHLSETGQLQNLQSAGSNLNVQYHFAHIFILIYHTDLMDIEGGFCDRNAVSQLALRALLTGLALAD